MAERTRRELEKALGGQELIRQAAVALAPVIDALMAEERERHTKGLQRADEHLAKMREEMKLYADGEVAPVTWSLYNAMHQRALKAERTVRELEKDQEKRAKDELLSLAQYIEKRDPVEWALAGMHVGADLAQIIRQWATPCTCFVINQGGVHAEMCEKRQVKP